MKQMKRIYTDGFPKILQINLRSFAPFCVICVHSKSVIICSICVIPCAKFHYITSRLAAMTAMPPTNPAME